MEQTENNTSPIKHTRDQISEIIARYDKKNGFTVKEFCKRNGISEGSFYSARGRQRSFAKSSRKKTGFIAIGTSPSPQSATLFAEVNGIKIYQAVPADYLKDLIS